MLCVPNPRLVVVGVFLPWGGGLGPGGAGGAGVFVCLRVGQVVGGARWVRGTSAGSRWPSSRSGICVPRANLSVDIAGFSGTTRAFQVQAPPRDAKRARQLSPSVVATTPAPYLVRHRCGRATPRRTL